MIEDNEFQQRIKKIEGLVRKVESMKDESERASALELFQSIMDLHGAGLERMMDVAFEAGDSGRRIIESFAQDDLISSLLLLYGLHPYDLETRVIAALDKVRPMLGSHQASVELLGVADGVVRLRLDGGGGCGSTAQALKMAVEEAVYDAAPDMTALRLEGGIGQPSPSALVQLKMSAPRQGSPRSVESGLATKESDYFRAMK